MIITCAACNRTFDIPIWRMTVEGEWVCMYCVEEEERTES